MGNWRRGNTEEGEPGRGRREGREGERRENKIKDKNWRWLIGKRLIRRRTRERVERKTEKGEDTSWR